MSIYQIPFVGLKIGIHHFEYAIDAQFFKHFEATLIHECAVKVNLEFEKKETLFLLKFFIDGTALMLCDRCLEPFQKEIFGDFNCMVKLSDELAKDKNDDDEIIYIAKDESHLDISQLIYEYIHLCLPMQLLHPKNEDGSESCNPEVLKILNKKSEYENQNDPRWSVLKNIKFDNN